MFDLPTSTDGAPMPLTVAAVLGGALWYYLKLRAEAAKPAPEPEPAAGGWLSKLLGNKTALLTALYAAFTHRRELVDAVGKITGMAWPLLVKIFGPAAPAPALPPDNPEPEKPKA